jgi:hypothetical protein
MAFPTRAPRRRLIAGVAVAIAVAACSDSSSGPARISNPAATIQDLLAVDSALQTDPFNALGLLVGNFPATAPPAAPLTRAVAALGVTLPPRLDLAAGAPRPRLEPLVGLAVASPMAPVIPDTLLGLTFEWNPDSLKYRPTSRAGGPQNGVRFILYREDGTTGYPDPTQEVGSLDIIDLAPASGAQLRFVVRGSTGSPTFLDYTLTFLPAAQAFTVQANGYISNGRPAALERRFTFDASLTSTALANGLSETVDFVYDVNVPDVAVELHMASVEDTVKDTTITSLDYRFSRRNENLRLAGADTSANGGATSAATFAVTVNGAAYATLRLVNGTATITDRNGAVVPVNGNDQQYEDDIVIALLFGVINADVELILVLSIPAILLGFSFGLL